MLLFWSAVSGEQGLVELRVVGGEKSGARIVLAVPPVLIGKCLWPVSNVQQDVRSPQLTTF